MISYDPSGYSLGDVKFYKDFASSMGLSANSLSFAPVNQSFQFSVTAPVGGPPTDTYFNIVNPNQPVTPSPTFFIHGYMACNVNCNAFGAATQNDTAIVVPSRFNGPLQTVVFDRRTAAAVETPSLANRYVFDSVAFQYLRMTVDQDGVGTTAYTVRGIFTGVMVSW